MDVEFGGRCREINENFDWQQAGGGIRMFIHYFNLLAQAKR